MHSLLLILERQAEDQLPGGKHHCPIVGLQKSAANVPTTSIIGEWDFGSLDMLDSLIMLSNNRTGDWCRTLSQEKREAVIEDARKDEGIIKRFKERREEVRQSRPERLKRKEDQSRQGGEAVKQASGDYQIIGRKKDMLLRG